MPLGAQPAKEALQEGSALGGANPFDDVEAVVEAGVFDELIERPKGAGLRVESAEDYVANAGVDQGAGAHDAGLERDDQGRAFEPPVAVALGRLAQHEDLGMRRRIAVAFATIASGREDQARGVE